MANFEEENVRKSFGMFLLEKMQLNHKTIENFSAELSMETRTLRSYLDGTFPPQKMSTVYRLIETLNVQFSDFENFLDTHCRNSDRVDIKSGPTININTGNTISNSPIGTQGNITFNLHGDD